MKCKLLLTSVAAAALMSATQTFGLSAYDTVVLNDSAYGYWPLQEINTNVLADIAGTNNGLIYTSSDPTNAANNDLHTTYTNPPSGISSDGLTYTLGGPGFLFGVPGDKAMYFTNLNGQQVNSDVVAAYDSTMDARSNFSAEAWVNLPTYPIGYTLNPYQGIFGLQDNSGTSDDGWVVLIYTDSQGVTQRGTFQTFLAKSGRNGWSQPLSTNNYSPGWVHVVITYELSAFKTYENGVLVSTAANPGYSPEKNSTHFGPFVIGSYCANYFAAGAQQSVGFQRNKFFHGGVSHVAFYTNVLTPQQILNHYLIGTQGSALPPTIGTQPVGTTNFIGYTRTLSVAAGGTSPIMYQWYKNGAVIPGETNTTLTFNNLVLTNAGDYFVTVTNALGGTNSVTATVGVLPLPSNPYQAAVVSEFPRAYYPLNETNGTVAADIIKTGNNNGTYVTDDPTNPPLLGQPGAGAYLGTSVTLDATVTNGIVVNDQSAMGITGPITLEAWVLVQNIFTAQNIVAHSQAIDANPNKQADILGIDEFGEYYIASYTQHPIDPTYVGAFYPVPLEDEGAWVHLVGTYDGTAWHLYRNGVELTNNPDAVGALSANGGWAIGGRNANSNPETVRDPSVTGSINNVAIYDYALTPQNVLQHYLLGTTQFISIQPSGPNVTLIWTQGFLQEAPSLFGPWTYDDTNVAISPYTTGTTNATTFFRTTTIPPP